MAQLPPSFDILKSQLNKRDPQVPPEYAENLDALLSSMGLAPLGKEEQGGQGQETPQAPASEQGDQPQSIQPPAQEQPQQPQQTQQQEAPEVTGYSNPTVLSNETPQDPPKITEYTAPPGVSLAGPGGSGQDQGGGGSSTPLIPPANQKIVPPAQQKNITDSAATVPQFKPKVHGWVAAGPKDKVGTTEWTDDKRGINMETEVVKQPDGTLKKRYKEVSKVKTKEERLAEMEARKNGGAAPNKSQQAVVDPATGTVTDPDVPAKSEPAQPPPPTPREVDRKMLETTKNLEQKVAAPVQSNKLRVIPPAPPKQKPLPPKSTSMSLPQSFDDLGQYSGKMHYKDSIAATGDVRLKKNDETGSEMEVEVKPGVFAPVRKKGGLYQVFVNNKWGVVPADRPLGQSLYTNDPLTEEGESKSQVVQYTLPNGDVLDRYSIGADNRAFNLSRPGQLPADGDRTGHLVLDQNGVPSIEDGDTSVTHRVENWASELPGQREMSDNYVAKYNQLKGKYKALWGPDGQPYTGSYSDAAKGFAQSLSFTNLNDARTMNANANIKFGGTAPLEKAITAAISDSIFEQLETQQNDAIAKSNVDRTSGETKPEATPDTRAKVIADVTDAAIEKAEKAAIAAGLSPKRTRALIESMTKDAFKSALAWGTKAGASSSVKVATTHSDEVSKSAAGEINHITPQQMLDMASEYARAKLSGSREYASVTDPVLNGGYDHASALNQTLQWWSEQYPNAVLNGYITGDDIEKLNPFKVLDSLYDIQSSPNSTSQLQSAINGFYNALHTRIPGFNTRPIELQRAHNDIGGASLPGSTMRFNNSVDHKSGDSTSETDTAKVGGGGGHPKTDKYSLISEGNKETSLGSAVATMEQEGSAISADDQKMDIEQIGAQRFGSPDAAAKMAAENSTIIYDYLTGLAKSDPGKIKDLTERVVQRGILQAGSALSSNSVTGFTLADYYEYVEKLTGLKSGEVDGVLGLQKVKDEKTGAYSVTNPGVLKDARKVLNLILKTRGAEYNGKEPSKWYKPENGSIGNVATDLSNGNVNYTITDKAPLAVLTPLVGDILAKGLIKGKDVHEARLKAQMGLMKRARRAF